MTKFAGIAPACESDGEQLRTFTVGKPAPEDAARNSPGEQFLRSFRQHELVGVAAKDVAHHDVLVVLAKGPYRIEGGHYPGFRGLVHCTFAVILRPAKLLFVNELDVVADRLQEVVSGIPQLVVGRYRYFRPELCDFSRETVGRLVEPAKLRDAAGVRSRRKCRSGHARTAPRDPCG